MNGFPTPTLTPDGIRYPCGVEGCLIAHESATAAILCQFGHERGTP